MTLQTTEDVFALKVSGYVIRKILRFLGHGCWETLVDEEPSHLMGWVIYPELHSQDFQWHIFFF